MINAMEYHKGISTKDAHAQVVYLYEVEKLTCDKIAEITHYAVSTVKNYVKKFADLLDYAKTIFGKIKSKFNDLLTRKERTIFECEARKNVYCAYVVEHFDEHENFLWLKIGKAKDVVSCAEGHLSRKTYQPAKIKYNRVKAVIYTYDEDDALTIENALRKFYKKQFKNGFMPRDRFSNCHYSESNFLTDKDFNGYLKLLKIDKENICIS